MIIDSLKELDKIKTDLTIKEIIFQDVIYRRHTNPDGSVGGFVAETAKVEKTCFIEFSALVCDSAKVYGTAAVCGNARIYGNASVYGDSMVYDDASVYGNAMVYDNSRVHGNAQVCENSKICGRAWIYENARILGNAIVGGNAKVYGHARVYGNAKIKDNADIYGNTHVCGNARVYGNAIICGNAKIYDDKIDYLVKTITFAGFTLSFTKNYVFAGCKFKWRISDIDKIKYKEVEKYVSKKQFLYLKKIIKLMIDYEKI